MKRVLADIQAGKFARDWMLENKVNLTSFKATRAKLAQHPIEEVGAKLRRDRGIAQASSNVATS